MIARSSSIVDGRVVRGLEPDEEVLRVGGYEPREQLLEPRGRVFRRAAAARGEIGELDVGGVEIHKDDLRGVAGLYPQNVIPKSNIPLIELPI